MKIKEIKGLKWPRPEDLRKRVKRRFLSSNELLALKSRSFYLPIQMLELARGRDEINKRPLITDLYNVLRYLDTIEDANPEKINSELKKELISEFGYIINGVARRNPSESIDDLVNDNLSKLTNTLKLGVMSEEERVFIEHFNKVGASRGVLQRIRSNATTDVKEAILLCTTSMATGMTRFLTDGKIDTTLKLDEYCGFVAGDVGVALNRINEKLDGVKLDDDGAKIYGLSLQKTNVLKNIAEDWQTRRVIYLPKELFLDVSNEELFDMSSARGKSARDSVLATMVSNTRADLRKSAEYIASIPEGLTGYQAFSLIPFFAAVETIRTIEEGGAEAVFQGRKDAIKMNEKILDSTGGNLGKFVYSLVLENGRKTKEFLDLYIKAQDEKDHGRYCFKDERFKQWSEDLFK